MNHSIETELMSYITDEIATRYAYEDLPDDISDLHFHLFNEDYYIIGYYQAEKWLHKHNLNAFAAIRIVQEYELDNFGECDKLKYDNAEAVVNMLAYIYGEQLLNENFQYLFDNE